MRFDFSEEEITKEFIENRISHKEIYDYYCNNDLQIKSLYKSPLRDNDSTPSFNILYNFQGKLIFKDFGYSSGDVYNFVQLLFGCDFYTALNKIAKDFRLTSKSVIIPTKRIIIEDKYDKQIIPVFKSFTSTDYDYWNRYHIPLTLLLEKNVSACKYIYLKKDIETTLLWAEYNNSNPIYSYKVSDKYKIYRPLADKKSKWLSNTTNFDIQGLENLPAKGELLIITSSMKDVLVLNVFGFNAIAPCSEGALIPESIMDFLWSCFDNIVVLYDSDKAGQEGAEKLIKAYPGIVNSMIPYEYEAKDISDFIEHYGFDFTKQLLKSLF